MNSHDLFIRLFLIVCGAVLAIPSYLLWREPLALRIWPHDFNGWLGLILMPLFSIIAFLYGVFYRRAAQQDDALQDEMDNKTRRGRLLFDVLYSLIFIVYGIGTAESYIAKGLPITTTRLLPYALLLALWIGGIIVAHKVDDASLHAFFQRKGWHRIDRLFFKDDDCQE